MAADWSITWATSVTKTGYANPLITSVRMRKMAAARTWVVQEWAGRATSLVVGGLGGGRTANRTTGASADAGEGAAAEETGAIAGVGTEPLTDLPGAGSGPRRCRRRGRRGTLRARRGGGSRA